MLWTASSSPSLCAGIGRDRVSEQRSSCSWPSSHPALLLHYQCCPQQPQHHLDGDTTVQCQPTWAGTEKTHLRKKKKRIKQTNPTTWLRVNIWCKVCFISKFFCGLQDNSIRWHIPLPHRSISCWFCLQRNSSFDFCSAAMLCVLPLFYTLISLPDSRHVEVVIAVCLWWWWRPGLQRCPLWHSSSFFDCVIPFELVNMQLQARQAHLPPFPLNSGTGRPCK